MSSSEQQSSASGSLRPESELETLRRENAELKSQLRTVEKERVEYLQNVSHQLVAPLNAIKWHIENLTQGRIGVERAQKVLRSIYSQATIAVHLAKNFVFMSSLEADHTLAALREALEPVTLEKLAVNLADDFQPLGWSKGIHIEVDTQSFRNIPDVLAMKPLLTQVFSNIIENGLKYSDENTSIVISGAYEKATDIATVRISNRGIGIEKGDIEAIFRRGFRSERAKSKYPAGTGFGLYIAQKIVAVHEGTIRVYNEEPGRTVFEVSIGTRKLEGKARQWPKKPSS
jgi:signal transduction histidine kinase